MGGQIFAPSDETEIRQLQEVARKKSFGLKWPVHQIWIAFKIADTNSKVYPPKVVPVKAGETPFWLSNTKITTALWESNVKTMVRFGRNQRMKMKNIKMKKGKWSLTKPGIRTFGAAAVCEMKKPKQVVGDPQVCWQPQSDIFDRVEYSGDISTTDSGFECANWDDESQHSHEFKSVGSHNFCRNPGNEAMGPWCYVNKPGAAEEDKWDYCPVPMCKEPENEFVGAQATCGRRPVIDAAMPRVINGRPAEFGESPYQIRLRYYKKLSIGGKMTDHQCGGSLISSCWAITAAHCIPQEFWFTNKGGGEFWFRVDVGNRFYQHDLSSNEYPAEDLQNHQSLRVKKIILHPKYNGVEHDLALIQLYPSSESGECAVFSDQIQPTCINQEHHRFKEGTTCMISGWGDVNQKDNGIQQPESLQVAFVQIANFEKCAEAYKPLSRFLKTRKHLCAQGDGTDTCQGDSGGPLVCFLADKNVKEGDATTFAGKRTYLAGVVSFGAGCAKAEYPGVYVPTSYFYDWIKKEVDKNPPVDFDDVFVCKDAQC